MTDLKKYAAALALLLLIPVGLATMTPDQLIIEGGFDEVATISDVVLADLTPHTYDDESLFREERVVEGHIVFITIDIKQQVQVQNGSVDITGFVNCSTHANATGPLFLGVLVPNRIQEAHEECHVGHRVVVTPDPFTSAGSMSTPQPTGVVLPFTAPSGEQGYAEEFAYSFMTFDPQGLPIDVTRFAWAVPILHEWTDAHGRQMNFFDPLPNDRLMQLDTTNFQVVFEKNFPHG